MAEITKLLGIAISDADAGRITRRQLLEIFQDAIDNGDILVEDNELHVVAAVFPLIDAGVLKRSDHVTSFEKRMNSRTREWLKDRRGSASAKAKQSQDDEGGETDHLHEPASTIRGGGTTGRTSRMNRKRVRLWLGVSIAVFLAALLFYHMPYPLSAGVDHIDARGNFNDGRTEFSVSLYNGNRGVALQTIRIVIREKINCRRRDDWPVDSLFTRERRYRHSFKDAVTPLSARRFSFPVQRVTAPYDNCASPVYDGWWIEGGWIRVDLF